jgi:hypothetical protein
MVFSKIAGGGYGGSTREFTFRLTPQTTYWQGGKQVTVASIQRVQADLTRNREREVKNGLRLVAYLPAEDTGWKPMLLWAAACDGAQICFQPVGCATGGSKVAAYAARWLNVK